VKHNQYQNPVSLNLNFPPSQYKEDKEFWAKYNAQPSWTYFGAHNGLFRKIPAIHQEVCGQYDPRRRHGSLLHRAGQKM